MHCGVILIFGKNGETEKWTRIGCTLNEWEGAKIYLTDLHMKKESHKQGIFISSLQFLFSISHHIRISFHVLRKCTVKSSWCLVTMAKLRNEWGWREAKLNLSDLHKKKESHKQGVFIWNYFFFSISHLIRIIFHVLRKCTVKSSCNSETDKWAGIGCALNELGEAKINLTALHMKKESHKHLFSTSPFIHIIFPILR